MTTIDSATQLGALLGISSSSAATPASNGVADVTETRNDLANKLFQSDMADFSSGKWVGLQDTLADGIIQVSFVELGDEALGDLTALLTDLKSNFTALEANGDADGSLAANIASIEKNISILVGQNKILQPEAVTMVSSRADTNIDGTPTTLKDYASVLNINADGLNGELTFIEVDMNDVINAYHVPDGCPICALNASNNTANTSGTTVNAMTPTGTSTTSTTTTSSATSTATSSATPTAYTTNTAATATNTTVGMPSTTATASGTNSVDSLIMGPAWDASSGDPLTWSLYDSTAGIGYDQSGYYSSVTYDDTAASITSQAANIQQAFSSWDATSALDFQQVVEGASGNVANQVGDIRIAYSPDMPLNTSTADPNDRAAAFALTPFTGTAGGDVWFDNGGNSGYTVNQNLSVGTYGYTTAIHEFGHAVGLSHPFVQPGTSTGHSASGDYISGTEDQRRNSVMSYNQSTSDRNLTPTVTASATATGGGGFTYSYSISYAAVQPITPMRYDIAAMEQIYGVSTNTETGNTSHSASALGFSTIVDSAGIDTLDASSETTASTINLTAGAFSSIGTTTRTAVIDTLTADINTQIGQQVTGASLNSTTLANIASNITTQFAAKDSTDISGDAIYVGQDNLAIAYSATIENAIGGAGNDTITGSQGVDNAIKGGAGDDTIDGLGGTDTAVYTGNLADYTISHNTNGTVTVTDNRTSGTTDGSDTLSNMEAIEFADLTYDIATQATTATTTSALVSGTPAAGVTTGSSSQGSSGSSSGSPGGSSTTSPPHGYTGIFAGGAQAAIESIDVALKTIGQERAKLAAFISAMEHSKSVNMQMIENTSAARSRIVDADYAIEMANLIKAQIGQEILQTMLGQANASSSKVMELLR